MLLSPIRLVLVGMAVFVFMMLIAPLDLRTRVSLEAIIFIILYLVCFIAGCLSKISHGVVGKGSKPWRGVNNLPAIRALGLVGFILKFYDVFILRGIVAATTAAEARELATESDAGVLAMIASVLIQFTYIPLIANLGLRSLKLAKPNLALDVTIFILPMLLSLIMLSRVSVIAGAVSLIIAYSISFNMARLLSYKIFFWASVSLLGIIAFSGALFSLRLEMMSQYSMLDSIQYSAYARFLLPTDDLLVILKGSSGVIREISVSGVSLLQYYLHGIAEFFYLMDNRTDLDHSGGQIIFNPILKGLSILSGVSLNFNLDSVVLRQGVFISHFGIVWVEFGWWGIIFGGFLGYFIQSVMLDYRRGNLAALPLAVYLGLVVLFMPMADFLTLGRGNYLIIVLVFNWLFFSRLKVGGKSVGA